MAKTKTKYVCQNCGYETAKWMGKCSDCDQWNTFVEEIETASTSGLKSRNKTYISKLKKVQDVQFDEKTRTKIGIEELDRVLGGGIVKGSLILIGGDPGIGKSTIILQVADKIASKSKKVLYISGEESEGQIKLRADRLGSKSQELYILAETDLSIIKNVIDNENPDLLIVDSVQTLFNPEITSAPGSVSQVREVTNFFMKYAKKNGIATFIIGHVTKQGSIAGPKVLEHMVDTVLYFEGDKDNIYRVLRAVKNRFGSTNEIGIFEMTGKGLIEVNNPSEMLLSGRPIGEAGTIVVSAIEGTRPVMIEIQALVTPTSFGNPRRLANGLDYNRVSLLMAVLEKRIGFQAQSFDAYVNITGGIQIKEPALDLGVVMALMSSYKDQAINSKIVVAGEVGLAGEIRSIINIEKRIIEAEKLGFEKIFVPKNRYEMPKSSNIEVIQVDNIGEIINKVFGR